VRNPRWTPLAVICACLSRSGWCKNAQQTPGMPPLFAPARSSKSRYISSVRDAHLGFRVLERFLVAGLIAFLRTPWDAVNARRTPVHVTLSEATSEVAKSKGPPKERSGPSQAAQSKPVGSRDSLADSFAPNGE